MLCPFFGQRTTMVSGLGVRCTDLGVIREKDIISCRNGKVTFRYLHAKSKRYRTRTVSGEHFLYLLMQHVLPRGFRRTRSYGFLHHCSKKLIKRLQLLLRVKLFPVRDKKERAAILCPKCGRPMRIVAHMIARSVAPSRSSSRRSQGSTEPALVM